MVSDALLETFANGLATLLKLSIRHLLDAAIDTACATASDAHAGPDNQADSAVHVKYPICFRAAPQSAPWTRATLILIPVCVDCACPLSLLLSAVATPRLPQPHVLPRPSTD